MNIRCKGLSKSSAFKSQAQGASASATTVHDISRALTDTDSMEISMRSTDTKLQIQHETSPTVASGNFRRLAGHGSVHTDEKYDVMIPRVKSGDNNRYSLLQLPGVGGGGIRGERLSAI